MNNDINEKPFPREIFGKKLLSNTADYLAMVFDKGNIALISSKNTSDYCKIVADGLIKDGYFVRIFTVDERRLEAAQGIPECVRYIVGIGAGRIADITRLTATEMDIGYSIIPTAPSTESYNSNNVPFTDGGIKQCSFPDMIIIDEDIIASAPDFLIAAGYGRVIAQLCVLFDVEFSRTVFADAIEEDAYNELSAAVRDFECNKFQPNFNLNLMKTLLKIARARTILNIKNAPVDCFAHILSETYGRTHGETSFIASYTIINFYTAFLSSTPIDTLLPADVVKSLKLLEKMKVINYNSYIGNLCVDDVHVYMKQSFIINEYRKELFQKLDGLDLSSLTKFWRRLYDDAGFWLKKYASCAAIMRYLSISAELGEKCLLKYIKRLGFLEKFI